MLHKTLEEALAEFTKLHEFQSVAQGIFPVVADQAAWLKREGISLLYLNWNNEHTAHALHYGNNLGNPDVRSVEIDQPTQQALESHGFDRQTISEEVNLSIKTEAAKNNPWCTQGMIRFSISQTGLPEEYLNRLLKVFEQCRASNLMGVFHWKVDSSCRSLLPNGDIDLLTERLSVLLLDEVMELEGLGILSDFSLWIHASCPDKDKTLKIELSDPKDRDGYWADHRLRMQAIRDHFEHELMMHM